MFKPAAALAALLTGAGAVAAPPANADIDFVKCGFGVDKPYVYDLDGRQYVGSRMVATNCVTDLINPAITLELDMMPSTEQPDGTWKAHTVSYSATINVATGGTYEVRFPNDDRLIPLQPGMYVATGRATSTLPGFEDVRHITSEAFTYGVPTA